MEKIPLLKPTDVELRVAQTKKTKYGVYVNLLVYKNARVDMRVLDKVYGPTNWQRRHKLIGNSMYAISVPCFRGIFFILPPQVRLLQGFATHFAAQSLPPSLPAGKFTASHPPNPLCKRRGAVSSKCS